MREDTFLRFRLAGQLARMPYGNSRLIRRDDAAKAWPPTGNEDRSMEGALRAMALASGGNRPEEDLTTEQRIRRDLDESFEVFQRFDGDWKIHRRLDACPHCKGSGIIRQWPTYSSAEFNPNDASLSMDEVVTIETKPCDHRPA